MKRKSQKEIEAEENEARLRRQEALHDRIKDLVEGLPDGTVVADLAGLIIALMAKRNPVWLSKDDEAKIRDNYPEATPELIEERSMDEAGLQFVVGAGLEMARIAVDYSPLSHWKNERENDEKLHPIVGDQLCAKVYDAFDAAVKNGMSPFGAATTIILVGAGTGARAGVAWPALTRTLADGLRVVMSKGEPPPASLEEAEERALHMIMRQLGVSKATAKRYLAKAQGGIP